MLQVFAQENTTTSTCGNERTLQVTDTSGLELLQSEINCQDGGEIFVLWSGEIGLNSPLEIDSGTNLSIAGRGGSAVARGNQTQLFMVYEGGELTLTDIELSGGKATYGGAISSNGNLVLNACVLEGNNATMSGGAVYAAAGTITISGSTFIGNNAGKYGGAVYALDAEMVIQNEARFEANVAEEGGAVNCQGTLSSTNRCTLDNAVFLRNNSSEKVEVDLGELVDIDDATRIDNAWSVIYGGGAASFLYSDVSISNCTFINNMAEVSGGALYGGDSTNMNITGCLFEDNYSIGYGGAITGGTMIIDGNTEVIHNYAERHGGGVSDNNTMYLIDYCKKRARLAWMDPLPLQIALPLSPDYINLCVTR